MDSRIGLMGGMFDPPHPGHRAIADSFLRSGYLDALWILPTAHPPHKPAKTTSFEHRLAMCRFAFDGLPGCVISDVESELASPNYTLHTVQHLIAMNPETEFCLCIGSDALESFHTWYRWEDLIRAVPLLVAQRAGFERVIPTALRDVESRIQFIRHEPLANSSTEHRLHPMSGLHPKVSRYIALNGLYPG